MRLCACLGMMVLVLSGCAHIPDHIRIDIDGSTIEIVKEPAPADDSK